MRRAAEAEAEQVIQQKLLQVQQSQIELEKARLEEEARIAAAAAARRASIDEVKIIRRNSEQFEDDMSKMRRSTFNDSGGSYTGDEMSDTFIEDID